jgi:protein-S-isoprenylcysteine O-methyltransferase Ste14
MKTNYAIADADIPSNHNNTLPNAKAALILAYGLISYAIGCAGLAAIILAMAGLLPMGSIVPLVDNNFFAILINIACVSLFGLQHSIMARPGFKVVFHRWFGEAGERSTFIWSSGVVSIILVVLWQPVDGTLWSVQSPLVQTILWCGFAFGWTYLLAATFAINHWDLFGLRQVWLAARNIPYTSPEFKENWMYRYSRHPIMLGVLIGIWCVPTMPATQFVLTVLFTVYIFVGVWFEERDLIAQFGERYVAYKRRVGMLFTFK